MSSSPGVPKVPPRPKIQLPLPGQFYPQPGMAYVPTPYGQTPIPMTPVSGQPQMVYSNRASEFVFSQFKGIKHLTKSGLSVGEKSAFWLYEKVSSWSKRWFTHIFLFVVVLLYSIGGAMIFVTIEGTHEDVAHFNIRKERNTTLTIIRELWKDEVLASNSDLWNGRARKHLMEYEEHLYEFYKRGVTDRGQKVWSFWNAVFYCGTIYTTIATAPFPAPSQRTLVGAAGCSLGRGVARVAAAAARRLNVPCALVARDSRARPRSIPAAAKVIHSFAGSDGAAVATAFRGGGSSSLCFISVSVSVCTGARGSANRPRSGGVPQRVGRPRRTSAVEACRSVRVTAMEDSYTVHRRRKAAARRREKTPDPSSRQQLVETSDDEEEEARRARMVKMADDAERSEQEKLQGQVEAEERSEEASRKRGEGRKSSLEDAKGKASNEKRSAPSDAQARENDGEEVRPVRKEPASKAEESPLDEVKTSEAAETHLHPDVRPKSKEIDRPAEPRKAERRLKKKSRERLEKPSESTDSSDLDEKHSRRTKSPEAGKVRMKKTSAKRNADPEAVKKEVVEKPPREKRASKQKLEEPDGQPRPERPSRRFSQTEDTDEDPKMKKSESLPTRSAEEVHMKRSSSDVKKQIIPLSNDSLIEDFAKAQREYMMRERSILDPDTPDVYEDAEDETFLRQRKFSVPLTELEQEGVAKSIEKSKQPEEKRSWFSWVPFLRKKKEGKESDDEEVRQEPVAPKRAKAKIVEVAGPPERVTFMDFLRALKDVVSEFKAFVAQNPKEAQIMKGLRGRCMSELMLVIIYCGLGAFVFRFTEGAFETFYKCGVKRVKRDFLDSLWNYSHSLREDDWKSMARRKLMEFEEQLHTAHEAGVQSYSGQRSWTFLNAVVYCLTVITTIGYGHISPSTNTGRAITIIYAIFGIPMFLIILADFGKLFTRGIKFLWAFVRRLYYTGSCRTVRRTGPVQEVMKGVQLVYDFATFKRPSQINPEDIEEMQKQAQQSQTVLNLDGNVPPDTPGTPAMSTFAIDDEFNLPISVAIFILLGYIFVGATLFCLSEGWGFFESFYFVFISMSTIGFGDYVPKHPIYMMCSIIYLVFGLALTSMCINVVQVMLSDSFRQASQKIGATIGFAFAEEDRSVNPAVPPPVEVADVHVIVKESESDEKIAPKAKQEDVDL